MGLEKEKKWFWKRGYGIFWRKHTEKERKKIIEKVLGMDRDGFWEGEGDRRRRALEKGAVELWPD